jgi:hypothetical protein
VKESRAHLWLGPYAGRDITIETPAKLVTPLRRRSRSGSRSSAASACYGEAAVRPTVITLEENTWTSVHGPARRERCFTGACGAQR